MYEVKKISAGILPTNTYVLYDAKQNAAWLWTPLSTEIR